MEAKGPDAQWLSYQQLLAQAKNGNLAQDAQEVAQNDQLQKIMSSHTSKKVSKAKKSRK